MKQLHHLTDRQLAIMDILWRQGEATAAEVHEGLVDATGLARKTIGTLLTRLEKQGVLEHRTEGREFVYRATVSRDQVRQATVHNVLHSLFDGRLPLLVSHALTAEEVEPGDVDRLRALIEEWERGEDKS